MNKLSAQNKWLLTIVFIILVNVAVWYFGLAPALDKVQAVRDENIRTEQQKANLEQRLEEIDAIDIEAVQREMDLLIVQLPELGLLREFLMDLEDTAGELGVRLGAVSALTQVEAKPYLLMNIRITLSGSYEQIFSYLHTLENHNRMLFVRSFSLSNSGEYMACGIDLQIYAEHFDAYTPIEAPGRDNPFGGQ